MNSLTFLAMIIGLGLALSSIGGWILTLLVFVVTLLLIIILVSSLFVDKSR